MLHKTKGIVLHSADYSETSLILKIYTETFGLLSFLVKGAKSQKSKLKTALFQPFSLTDLVIYFRERSSLHTIKEARISVPYQSIPFDIRKSSMALFINELIYRSIREEEANQDLFDFIWHTFIMLDTMDESPAQFHLSFTVKLTKYLGFLPQSDFPGFPCFFDLREGTFKPTPPAHGAFLDPKYSDLLYRFLNSRFEDPETGSIPLLNRRILLDKLLEYYQFHLPGFRGIRSHEILHQVLS